MKSLETNSKITITIKGSLQPITFSVKTENQEYYLNQNPELTELYDATKYTFTINADIDNNDLPINEYDILAYFEIEKEDEVRFKSTSNSNFVVL